MSNKKHIVLFVAGVLLLMSGGILWIHEVACAAEEGMTLKPANITLELKLSKDKVIRGESVPFEAVLNNGGDQPVEMDDVAPSNETFYLVIKGKASKETKGSLMTPFVKTGGKPVKTEEIGTFLLNPDQTKVVAGDLLNIFGDISEGEYKVVACYKAKGGVDIISKETALSIEPANPIYAYSQWEYDKVAESNLKTVWVNKGRRYGIFYTENNPKNPEVVESSYKVWESDSSQEVRISSVNDYMQKKLHLVWATKTGFYYMKIVDSKGQGQPKLLPVSYKGFRDLNPPFTDKDGALYLFAAVELARNRNTIFAYKIQETSSKPEKIKVAEIKGPIGRYFMVVDTDSKLYFACESDGKIAYFSFDLYARKLDKDVSRIENIPGKIVDLVIAQQYQTEKGKNANFIYYLTKVKGTPGDYVGYYLQVGTTEPKWYPKMTVAYPREMRVTQSVMDTFLRPYYLLQTRDVPVKTFYKSYFSIDLDQILPPQNEPKALCTYPQILVTSSMGDNYAVWLRYIKDRRQIVYKQLEEIKK